MIGPIRLVAVLGVALAFRRRIENGRESLGAGLVLPIGYLVRRGFPRGLGGMLGLSMIGAGPTLALVLETRSLWERGREGWAVGGLTLGVLEVAGGLLWFWPALAP
ncbi:MAG: hypothetical protein AB7I19_03505 [Planctomycetota bacterium]